MEKGKVHQIYFRRLERRLCPLCLLCSPGICLCQLRFKVRSHFVLFESQISLLQVRPKEGKDETPPEPVHTGITTRICSQCFSSNINQNSPNQPPGGGYFDPDDHLDDDLDTEEEPPARTYKSKKEQGSSSGDHQGFTCKSSPSFNHIHNHKSFSPSDPLQPQHQELWKNTSGHLILYPGRQICQT